MTEDRNVKMVFKNTPQRKRFLGKPRKRWLDDANCLKKMGVRGWWKIAKDREAWKLILKNGGCGCGQTFCYHKTRACGLKGSKHRRRISIKYRFMYAL